MFPSNSSFSCPAGPSLRLNCTFVAGASNVFWTSPGIANIPNGHMGHSIDNSLISSGVSYLKVDKFSETMESYICTVVFPGDLQESSYMRPEIASKFPQVATHSRRIMIKYAPVYQYSLLSLSL